MAATGRIDGIFDGVLRGWAWDAEHPSRRLDLVVRVDGAPIATRTASRYRGDLQRGGIGDGSHGVELPLPLAVQDGQPHGIALLLDQEGDALILAEAQLTIPHRAHMLQGKLERIADGRAIGWIWDQARPGLPVQLELLVEGVVVGAGWANRFRNDLAGAGIGGGAHGFVLDVPAATPAGALSVRAIGDFGQWQLGSLPYAAARGANPAPSGPIRSAFDRTDAAPPRPARTAPRLDLAQTLADARDAERRRDFAAAERLLEAALRRSPTNFDALFLRARIAMALQDLVTAERCARAALDERPGHVRPSVLLARIANAHGNHAEAIKLWSRVGPGDDNYRERLIKRGRGLLALGRPLEALGEFAAARRLHPEDRDALFGIAEAVEATGSRATALRHWHRVLAVAEQNPQATARIAALSTVVEAPQGIASPLRTPTLRQWQGAIEGTAGAAPVTPAEGLALRSLAPEPGRLAFAAAEPSHRRPGELPGYGLWLRAEGGAAEARFALSPDAGAMLANGLCMGIELRVPREAGLEEAALPVALWLVPDADGGDAPPARMLLKHQATGRPGLLRFDLRLDPAETTLLLEGRLGLALRLLGPGTLLAQPPRPLCVLQPLAPPGRDGPEDGIATANLRALGLLPASPNALQDVMEPGR